MLALDIGASKIRIAEVSGTKVKNKKQTETPKIKAKIKNEIVSLIKSYKKQPVGIGIAALLRKDITITTPNMDFENINVKSYLQKRLKVKVYVDNDANCAGLAEQHFGHGKGKKNFVLLTLGTGIGGAIIINNKLYHGVSMAGEPGQMLIEGKRFETIASAPASVRLAHSLGLKKLSLEIESLAHHGNKKALQTYKEIGRRLGIGMLNIAYILDPEIIILGGGFAKVEFIHKSAIETLHKNDIAKRNIPVKHAKLGDDAGLIGAALLHKQT